MNVQVRRVIAEFVVRDDRVEHVQKAIDKLVKQLNDPSYRGPGFQKPVLKHEIRKQQNETFVAD